MTPPFALTGQDSAAYDLLIVDGSYLIHRILYASGAKGDPPFSEMFSSRGEPTGAVYGCLKTLRAAIDTAPFKAQDLMVVWDGRPKQLSTRRMALYPGYKQHDPPTDPKEAAESERHRNLLEEQRPVLCNLLRLLGVPSVNLPYREGDDVVAWAVGDLKKDCRVLIMSDDRDYYQLVEDNVHVYRASIKVPVVVGPHNFEQVVGVKSPIRYLLSAAISGDGSDHITGIPGVGDGTAQKVANNADLNGCISYSAIEKSILKLLQTDSRNKRYYALLLPSISVVTRNLELMDLRLETPTLEEKGALVAEYQRPRGVQEQAVAREFDRLEFKSYLEDFSGWIQPFKRLFRKEVAA